MSLKKSDTEIKLLREGGKRLAYILARTLDFMQPGQSTAEINAYAEKLFAKSGGKPSFKGFNGFPAAVCISVNHEVVHGIPRSDKIIQEGDIVDVDVGLEYKGLFTDMSYSAAIGAITPEAKQLLSITKQSLDQAINQAIPGNTVGHIGNTIEQLARKYNYGVVRSLVGHGVGHAVHEEPRVPNFGQSGSGANLVSGMVIAIEPMFNLGSEAVQTETDGWTAVTADGSLSAHYEHTVAITEQGPEILTRL